MVASAQFPRARSTQSRPWNGRLFGAPPRSECSESAAGGLRPGGARRFARALPAPPTISFTQGHTGVARERGFATGVRPPRSLEATPVIAWSVRNLLPTRRNPRWAGARFKHGDNRPTGVHHRQLPDAVAGCCCRSGRPRRCRRLAREANVFTSFRPHRRRLRWSARA